MKQHKTQISMSECWQNRLLDAVDYTNSNIQILLHKSEVTGWWKLLSESFL